MKIKYLFYIGVATLALSGCNDGFLERAPEAINDKTFWNTTGDLETYANQFYSYLPGGVTSIADGESDNQVPNSIPQFFWNQLSTPAEAASWCNWSKGGWQPIRLVNYFLTHYQTVSGKESEINQYVAEVRFFKAMQYAGLMRTFGDIPWLDKDLGTGDTDILYGPKTKTL